MKISVVTPLWQDRPAAENLEVAINADRLGFPELWIGEMATYDAFAFATMVGQKTEKITLTTGPLAVSIRTPATMAIGVASVAELTGRTTNLAVGTSSVVVVEHWHGQKRTRSARHLAETAQIVRGLLDGEKVRFEGEVASCKNYRLRLDASKSSLTIAAFGPAAVSVAARHSDRMLLNLVTPQSLAQLRRQMEQAAEKAALPPPALAVWLPCAIDPEREAIDQILRTLVGYLAAPGYSEMFSEAGFLELVEFARTGPHPKELLAAIPENLSSAIGLVGSEAEVISRLEEYRAAGADEVCLVPATAGDAGAIRTLKKMSSLLEVSQGFTHS
tara:strand:- start:26 stop:1018 length:993 start_codon:yes stop_codon:yes gene_type:complete